MCIRDRPNGGVKRLFNRVTGRGNDYLDASLDGNTNELEQFFNENRITDLVIAGANGGYCVKDSISAALVKGYSILSVSDAIIDLTKSQDGSPSIYQYPYRYSKDIFWRYGADQFNQVSLSGKDKSKYLNSSALSCQSALSNP